MRKIDKVDIIRILSTIFNGYTMIKMFTYLGINNEKTAIYGSICFISSLICLIYEIYLEEKENSENGNKTN